MKTTIQQFKGTLAAALVGSLSFVCVPAQAAHELIYGLDQFNNMISFYSDAPSSLISVKAINGTQNNEEIRGLDYWNGTFYGLGSYSQLYTLNPSNAQATPVGTSFLPGLNGLTFGADNQPSGFRVVSGLGQNLLIDRGTGVAVAGPSLAYGVSDPFFGMAVKVDALAYDNMSGIFYGSDTLQNTLVSLDPTTGLVTTIGLLGIDAARYNGLDISPSTGILYMDTPASSSDPQANLYTIDKITGIASLVGQIGSPGDGILVRGLTAVPEPGSVALMTLGGFALLIARRRR